MATRIFRLLLALVVTTGLTACSMFSSDDGEVRAPTPLTKIEEQVQLTKVWSKSVGKGVGGSFEHLAPSVSGEVIFAAGAEGSVIALEAATGKVLWQAKLNINIGGGVNAASGMVLLGTLDGRVFALDQADGSELWKARVSSEVISPPQTNGSTVIVQSIDDAVTALNAENGEQIWRQENLQPSLTLRGSSTPLVDRDAVIAGFSSGEARAYRLQDGTPLWTSRVAVPRGTSELERMVDINAAPLNVDDQLFMVSFQGNAVSLDLYSGRVRWSRELSSYKSMAQGFGSLYLTDEDSYISSIDQRTGAVSWRQNQLSYRLVSAPATFSNYVVVGDLDGYVHLMNQLDGALVGRFKAGAAIKAQPLVSGDMLYILDAEGQLTAIRQKPSRT